MFIETRKETVMAKHFTMPPTPLTRVLDVFACDDCGQQHTCLRLSTDDFPHEAFYCRSCNGQVSVAAE